METLLQELKIRLLASPVCIETGSYLSEHLLGAIPGARITCITADEKVCHLPSPMNVRYGIPLSRRMHLSGEPLQWYLLRFPELIDKEVDVLPATLPDDQLFLALDQVHYRPDLVILGGPRQDGYFEFLSLISLLKKSCYIVLLGTSRNCLRHGFTSAHLTGDPRFKVCFEGETPHTTYQIVQFAAE